VEGQDTTPILQEKPPAGSPRTLSAVLAGLNWTLIFEIGLILLWAAIVAYRYFDFNPEMIPAGREFSSAIQAHHLWTRFTECGLCALWDGSERGGFPAFVDPLASALHPLVTVTTLAFGVVNGAKVTVVAALAAAGLAQLWLGRELGLKAPARIWAALLVIPAGHLSGKMELGLVSVVLSTAMASFTLPAALYLARKRTMRGAVILGIILALLAVAGQGYIQAGFLFSAPAYLLLLWGRGWPMFRRYLLAAGLGLLLAAPFLLPFLHFYPNFVKDSDPTLSASQPLGYYLLNLVIDDPDFLFSTALDKLPYPHLYTFFIGWIPLLFAVLCLRYARREDARKLLFLLASAGLAVFIGSGIPLRWFMPLFSGLAALRFAPMIGGLAVPPLLGLAGYGLNGLLNEKWPALTFYVGLNEDRPAGRQLDLRWLMVIPLLLSLWQGFRFAQHWLYLTPQNQDVAGILDSLETTGLAWVQPPFGEHPFIEPAVARGLKLSPGIMTWRWKDRPFPQAVLEANRAGPPPASTGVLTMVGDVPIYHLNTPPYAGVLTTEGVQPCLATGTGGELTVICNPGQSGHLNVQENFHPSWMAWRDGRRIPILDTGNWLAVNAPAGESTFLFRFLPWDVPVGLGLFIVGVVLCIILWRRDAATHPPPA
jgi:hypothetical protein